MLYACICEVKYTYCVRENILSFHIIPFSRVGFQLRFYHFPFRPTNMYILYRPCRHQHYTISRTLVSLAL